MIKEDFQINRRGFIKLGAASVAGLIIGISLPSRTFGNESSDAMKTIFTPNAWLTIEDNGQVSIFLTKSEMGQGVMTALPMLIAEELEVDLSRIQVKMATSHERFGSQYTGGSQSISENWVTLRRAGAAARMILINAAAQIWGVPPDTCYAVQGVITQRNTDKKISYAELVSAAIKQPIPEHISLKSQKDFRVIGQNVKRLDIPDKVTGRAKYGVDIRLPGMLVATIAHPTVFGAKIKKYDAAPALAVKGVHHVLEIDNGVVVVADGYWQAQKGLQSLDIEWYPGAYPEISSSSILARDAELAKSPGEVIYEKGTEYTGLQDYNQIISVTFHVPYQTHATMETMNCTAHVHKKGCDIWAPTQYPRGARNAAAEYVYGNLQRTLQKIYSRFTGNLYPNIVVHKTYIGCGFGRRLKHDFVVEAVQISKKLGVPIKLIWSREEDIRHGYYRPATFNKLDIVLDRNGYPLNWVHRIVGPEKGLSVDGAENIAYAIPYCRIESIVSKTGVPIGSWRSTGGSQSAFIIESLIDEIASANNFDPYDFRKRLLKHKPGHQAVLKAVTEASNWRGTLPEGHYQGMAIYESRGSTVAQVAEVSVSDKGIVKVHKVNCAIDCGIVVNHEIVKSQLEGGIIFGLTAAIKNEITVNKGGIVESNFDDFPVIRMDETPEINISILPVNRSPCGVGEVAVPAIAPAIANAVFAATGKRIRKLPIRPSDIIL